MNKAATTGGEGMDTFSNMTPIEPAQPDVSQATDMNNQVANAGVDTFDNTEVVLPDSMKEETKQEETKDVKEKQEKKPEDTKEVKGETDSLEDQEPDDEGTKAEAKGEEREDTTPEETEPNTEETVGDKLEGKTIRLKVGDEKVDINENATVPVKVKGKKEFVTLNELRENFSGKKAWGEEIEATKVKQVEIEKDRELWEAQRNEVKSQFAKIGEMIHKGFEDPEADPLNAMKYLVELSGRNVLDFEKRMMDHYGNLAINFSDMGEAEQKLYWTEREIEILRNKQATQAKETEERTASEQRNTRINEVREKYGVSEQEYSDAEAELEGLGYDLKDATLEQVSHYAALKPLVAQAGELAKPFEEDLSTDEYQQLVTGTADTMYKFKDLDKVEALKITAKRMGYEVYSDEDLVEELKEKTKKPESRLDGRNNARKVAQREDDHVESFDDFENEFYYRR